LKTSKIAFFLKNIWILMTYYQQKKGWYGVLKWKNGGNHVYKKNLNATNEMTKHTPKRVHLYPFEDGGGEV
jgi:hypothetical protein